MKGHIGPWGAMEHQVGPHNGACWPLKVAFEAYFHSGRWAFTSRAWGVYGGGGIAPELHGLTTAEDYGRNPRALALRRWAESTVFPWAREVRLVGQAGLLYAECSKAEALARYLVQMAQASRPSAALCGTISAVCTSKKLQRL